MKPKPQYSDGRWVGSMARKTNSEQQIAMHASGMIGNSGAAYFRSATVPPLAMCSRRKRYWA
ncbi:hypothetical protein D3C78_1328270 [compost metagenome]